MREFSKDPCADGAVESPALSGSIGSPGVVDQPARELDEEHDDEEIEEVDRFEGQAMEERGHRRPVWWPTTEEGSSGW